MVLHVLDGGVRSGPDGVFAFDVGPLDDVWRFAVGSPGVPRGP
jgi:hypothetical protein